MLLIVTDRLGKPALINVGQVAHISATSNGGTYFKFSKEDGVTAKDPFRDVMATLRQMGIKMTHVQGGGKDAG